MAFSLDKDFGKRLKQMRKERKLFRFQVARKVGCETQLIKRLEKGYARTISSVQLKGICNALGILPEAVLEEQKEA